MFGGDSAYIKFDVSKKFEQFLLETAEEELGKYITKVLDEKKIPSDEAKMEFIYSMLNSEDPDVFDVSIMKEVGEETRLSLKHDSFTVMVQDINYGKKSPQQVASVLNETASRIAEKLKEKFRQKGVELNEQSKDFRRLVATTYLMYNSITRHNLNYFDAHKEAIEEEMKNNDKGRWILDAMERVSNRSSVKANN